jgi:hypothetical protein
MKGYDIIFIVAFFSLTIWLVEFRTYEIKKELKPSQCDSLSNWKSERLIIYMEVTDMQSEIINNHKSSKEEMENDTALLNTIQKLY